MSYILVLSYLVLSSLASYIMCRSLVTISHRHALLDQANTRSSHSAPTPRIGGLSFVFLNSLLLVYFIIYPLPNTPKFIYWVLLLPPLLVALVSIVEDLTNRVSRKIRLIAHLSASTLALVYLASYLETSMSPVYYIIVAIGITWFINLYNFMDGIDGIATTQGLFIILTSSILAFSQHHNGWGLLLTCLSGPLIGFLIINWQPARIFMGDIGSTYLGMLLPTILLINMAENIINVWSAVILTGTFLADATWTLAFRFFSSQAWYTPHRSHAYQILSRKLNSHSKVNLLNFCINTCWLLPLSLLANALPNYGQFFTILALVPLILLAMMTKAGHVRSN
jgi:Fuc2NAc and GlcNAc transferase